MTLDRLAELEQMCNAPYDAYSAGAWCEAANELVAICHERRAIGLRTFEILKEEREEALRKTQVWKRKREAASARMLAAEDECDNWRRMANAEASAGADWAARAMTAEAAVVEMRASLELIRDDQTVRWIAVDALRDTDPVPTRGNFSGCACKHLAACCHSGSLFCCCGFVKK